MSLRYAFGMEVALETTRGTAVAPTKALCLTTDASLPSAEHITKDIKKMATTAGQAYSLILDPSKPKASFSVSHWIPKAIKDASTDVIAELFTCCGMKSEAILTPSAGFKFSPITNGGKTFSAKATSARFSTLYKYGEGNFDINFALDEPLEVNYSFSMNQDGSTTELAEGAADNTIPSLALVGDTDVLYYNSTNPVTINGNPACIKDVKFSQGNELKEQAYFCGKGRDIIEYIPKLELSHKLTKAFEASFNDMKNGTEFNIVIPVSDRLGAEVGQFVFPKCVVDSDSPTNSDGLFNLQRTLSCRSTAGDDNYYFEFYT